MRETRVGAYLYPVRAIAVALAAGVAGACLFVNWLI